MTDRNLDDRILDHLDFVARRDAEKGGSGDRTTREIADHAGAPVTTVRRHLDRLYAAGRIDAFAGGLWRRSTTAGSETPKNPAERESTE